MLTAPPIPTDAELAILRVLWTHGPSTVRQVTEVLERDRPTGYTTALKFLQIMHEKGLVVRDESERSHVYRPRQTAQQTQRQLVRDLVERAFDGSTARLALEALAVRRPSPEEAAEIRRRLDEDPAARANEPSTDVRRSD